MSKLLSKEEFAAKISANRARIAEAQLLDSSLVDIDFSNRIDDHGDENSETLLEMESLISELHNRRVISDDTENNVINGGEEFETEAEATYLKSLEFIEDDESKLAVYEQQLVEGRLQSQKLHDLVNEVAAGYKPMSDVKELSSLAESNVAYNNMVAGNDSEEHLGAESIQHMLARFGIHQSQLELASGEEQRDKIIQSEEAFEDELFNIEQSLRQFTSDLDHLLK